MVSSLIGRSRIGGALLDGVGLVGDDETSGTGNGFAALGDRDQGVLLELVGGRRESEGDDDSPAAIRAVSSTAAAILVRIRATPLAAASISHDSEPGPMARNADSASLDGFRLRRPG